jgi:SAM-dependent methyltransferase
MAIKLSCALKANVSHKKEVPVMANFTEISSKYENNAIVQKSASEILFDLLDIQANDNVLDLGCGTGHITKIIRDKTEGKVIGVDPSEGMIEKAKEKYSNLGIVFRNCSAEELDYQHEFDVIFCNSAFQWFKDFYTPQKLDRAKRCMLACHNLKGGMADDQQKRQARRSFQGQSCLRGPKRGKDSCSAFKRIRGSSEPDRAMEEAPS